MSPVPLELIDVYSVGICYASVCAPNAATKEDIEAAVNLQAPLESMSGNMAWHICDENFRTGELNPSPCPHRGETHKHWLLNC